MNLSEDAIQKALNNEWDAALSINKLILEEHPENIDALNRLAQAYLHLGHLLKAKNLYYQVLKLDHFNPIAKRNLVKIKTLLKDGQSCFNSLVPPKIFQFIEEPGKTKVVTLVRLGEKATLSKLLPCQKLIPNIRAQAVCLYLDKQYIGRLPDDIARRVIWLTKRDNVYDFYVKTTEKNKVCVFIKEMLQSHQNKNYSSFLNAEKISNSMIAPA